MSKQSRSMKAIKNISMIMGAALMLASCESIKEEVIPSEKTVEITAFIADGQTKTAVQDGGNAVYWQPGDEVKVFYDGTGSKFTAMCTSLSRTSKFTGSSNVIFGFDEGFAGDAPLWGLYPYRDDAIADNVSITTTLPSEQTACAGTFAQGMNISVARSTSLSMAFYNVCGGLRFTLSQEGIKSVTFQGLNDENIAGTMKISFSEGVPVIQEVTNGKRSITLTLPDDGVFETGKWYYISVIPGSLSKGYKMTFTTDRRSASIDNNKVVVVKRGIYGQLQNIDEGLPLSGNIAFISPAAKYACLDRYDADKDGEISFEEVASVTDISGLFDDWNTVTSFDELQYFTSLVSIGTALSGLQSLESVTLPASMETIDDNAFYFCPSLKRVIFPSSIVSIGNNAFNGCPLESLNLPEGLVSIGDHAFARAYFDTVAFPTSLQYIGAWAFTGSKLKSVYIPENVRVIKEGAFHDTYLKEAVIASSYIKDLPESIFQQCQYLSRVVLPEGLETIGNSSFRFCNSLKTLSLPETVNSIGEAAFRSCTSLESFILPSRLTIVSKELFHSCRSLANVTIPSSVTSIGDKAFYNCPLIDKQTSESKIVIPSNVASVGSLAICGAGSVIIDSPSLTDVHPDSFGTPGLSIIYVPDDKVEMYKARSQWANYSSFINSISSYSPRSSIGLVDLGLSVKWATCNIGATSPEDKGTYFSWGDIIASYPGTLEISMADWKYYKYCNGTPNTLLKYCTSERTELWNGFLAGENEPDNKAVLDLEDDPVHMSYGGNFRMPTKEEMDELIANTNKQSIVLNGVRGCLFTSRVSGFEDREIFLPLGGCADESSLRDKEVGYYWSSSLNTNDPRCAWYLYISKSGSSFLQSNCYRSDGCLIRPVSM